MLKQNEKRNSILASNKSIGLFQKERRSHLQNEKSVNMAEDIERTVQNYQKQREQHIRLKEKVNKKTLLIQTESRNRYETKKQHAEKLKEMEVMRLNHAS